MTFFRKAFRYNLIKLYDQNFSKTWWNWYCWSGGQIFVDNLWTNEGANKSAREGTILKIESQANNILEAVPNLQSTYVTHRLKDEIWSDIKENRNYILLIYIYRVNKKNVICRAWCQIVPFLCNSPVWCSFNVFRKFSIFLYCNGPKKNPQTFFLSKSKVQKSKNVNINYFHWDLKFYKD